ncbi:MULTISPECIES: sulfotransferase domain-containing protein [unclassified Mesorhizobium]|uniref:sulfotransferase domain-containing protein n=1 Tax=unclassified Mesorhizobium TaxID=325217 RepID=UPI002414D9EA|nr:MULTISPECIES: sulfotransferase domain-containing protein [unclassified Mesorhizobium]MDG4855153.1 sulfotransferase domain-containing protein [Mesorhizobium sp. WSM4982]MDG4913723.1 sulfotransferase domain-containing protein [Mesorhizobium sp. WSM4983]
MSNALSAAANGNRAGRGGTLSHQSGIVWLASYPKSGNTWTRHFLHSLLKVLHGEAGAQSINNMGRFSSGEAGRWRYSAMVGREITKDDKELIPTLRPKVQVKLAEEAGGVAFIKTHNALLMDEGQPVINPAATAGAVYIVRNPLDVVISLSHHRGKPIDDTIDFMACEGMRTVIGEKQVYEIWGSWSEHVYSWTRSPHPAIYVMRYEDMLAEPGKTFGGLARHLKMNPSAAELDCAIEMSSFDSLQAQEKEDGFRERPEAATANFFRSGRADQWRDVLTASQIDQIASKHEAQMQRFGYLPN